MTSETTRDEARCWIHGPGARVERFSGQHDPDSSAVRISWWECPQCLAAPQCIGVAHNVDGHPLYRIWVTP